MLISGSQNFPMSLKRLVRRHGTQAEWDAADPVLWEGEVAWATDTGVFKIGDGVRTWSGIGAANGEIMDRISESGEWDDLRVPFSSIKVGSTFPPTFKKWRDNGSGSTGVFGWAFSPTQLEQVHFDAQLPHAYKEGTRIAPHCHWIPLTSPTVGQTVRFGLEYTYANAGEVFPQSTIIYAEHTFVAEDLQYEQRISSFDPDIEDAGMKISAMMDCRFFRDATNDSYTGEVVVLEFDFHYLAETFGSISEFSKP